MNRPNPIHADTQENSEQRYCGRKYPYSGRVFLVSHMMVSCINHEDTKGAKSLAPSGGVTAFLDRKGC
jgi:hypothetical protein